MLTPNFGQMPQELRVLPRWVMWKGEKVPYCATAINGKASCTNSDTWASFPQTQTAYEEGGYLGVGFVLNGDGIAGVDLDRCVHDGLPVPSAMALLEQIGCQYVEFSPSGTGLRGFGYADNITGKNGTLDELHVELYTDKRYLTVTGHTLKNGPLVKLSGFADTATKISKKVTPTATPQKTPEVQQRTTDSHLLLSSVGCEATTPTRPGERNRCLFELARRLKAIAPDAAPQARRDLVALWHSMYQCAIGTKALSVSLDDFERAWGAVKFPAGKTLQAIIANASLLAPLPERFAAMGYGSSEIPLLNLCLALQAHEGNKPFFLSARTAAGQIGHTEHSTAAAMMRTFVRDGVLIEVSKGSGKKASRYLFPSTHTP